MCVYIVREIYIYIYTRAEASLKVAEKGGEGGEERRVVRGKGGIGEGRRGEGRGGGGGVAKLGCGLWAVAGARRANVAFICSVNIYIYISLTI